MPQIGPVPKPDGYTEDGEPSTPEDTTESDSQQGTIDMDDAERLPFIGGAYKAFNYMQEAQERARISGQIGDIEFTEEGIDKIIERVGRIADQLDIVRERAVSIRDIDSGKEQVSAQYKAAADEMSADYLTYHDKVVKAYNEFIRELESAKKNYLAHEQDVADNLGKADA
ncbi:hypothetical protein SAMN06265360_11435 [Haloechinothrix alba]|uniref:PE family protein n=1 Tax=Haloechinothrix alba TaxID=664784 RepID=A0A238YA31_9PSEU|nr:hypothetical protein [Haloechinothrix alba]SNR67189.1 hypothetical protein SAMN06265360_11435 [Haloechinothrix alba]